MQASPFKCGSATHEPLTDSSPPENNATGVLKYRTHFLFQRLNESTSQHLEAGLDPEQNHLHAASRQTEG